eukprot:Lithocolla_globosa_v1_NODE_523_length_3811_cov_20.780618.p2 type:complete len:123 gc:universal NODE_523_length_3811_cov_20.780618:2545-2913(+)
MYLASASRADLASSTLSGMSIFSSFPPADMVRFVILDVKKLGSIPNNLAATSRSLWHSAATLVDSAASSCPSNRTLPRRSRAERVLKTDIWSSAENPTSVMEFFSKPNILESSTLSTVMQPD